MGVAPFEEPLALFRQWMAEAAGRGGEAPANAMTLATADASGAPASRIVLLKEVDDLGFVFYTNLGSRKAEHLADNPRAALCFHWPVLGRQIRVEGVVEPVTDAAADAYFASRPRESQIGAWASRQSERLPNRSTLEARVDRFTREYDGVPVPRPPFWSGYRVIPVRIEFWQEQPHRLHERRVYDRKGRLWETFELYP